MVINTIRILWITGMYLYHDSIIVSNKQRHNENTSKILGLLKLDSAEEYFVCRSVGSSPVVTVDVVTIGIVGVLVVLVLLLVVGDVLEVLDVLEGGSVGS